MTRRDKELPEKMMNDEKSNNSRKSIQKKALWGSTAREGCLSPHKMQTSKKVTAKFG